MTFFNLTLLIQLIASFVGSCSFAVVFKINKRHLVHVGFLGFITYFVYYSVLYFLPNVFTAAFVSTTVATAFGELFARKRHAPTIVYLVTGLIPIVPGADSYYCMKYLLEENMTMALSKLSSTVQVALGIAGGIVVVSILFGIINDNIARKKQREHNRQKTT